MPSSSTSRPNYRPKTQVLTHKPMYRLAGFTVMPSYMERRSGLIRLQ